MPGNSVLLDTSVVVRHFRDATSMTAKLAGFDELFLPLQSLGELYYGALRSDRPEKHLAQIEQFLNAIDLLAPDKETAALYGKIAKTLALAGTPIPQNDIWIAAMAIQTGLPLATRDKHFDQVSGVQILNW